MGVQEILFVVEMWLNIADNRGEDDIEGTDLPDESGRKETTYRSNFDGGDEVILCEEVSLLVEETVRTLVVVRGRRDTALRKTGISTETRGYLGEGGIGHVVEVFAEGKVPNQGSEGHHRRGTFASERRVGDGRRGTDVGQ